MKAVVEGLVSGREMCGVFDMTAKLGDGEEATGMAINLNGLFLRNVKYDRCFC